MYTNSSEFNQNFIGDNDVSMDIDINMSQQVGPNFGGYNQMSAPIMEPMQERVVHRTIMHEVPHVCPIRTKIVNHHVFRHTYSPSYSCCSENTVSNVQCGSCCNFR